MSVAVRAGSPASPPDAVLAAWDLAGCASERVMGGLINHTFFVRQPGGEVAAVVQRLHPIFAGEVNIDIDAVTRHLAARGVPTPRLLPTSGGRRWVEHGGAVWRALSFVDGVTLEKVPDPAHAESVGELVGRFHRALADLDHEFAFKRVGVHDTAGHLARLQTAIDRVADADAAEGAEEAEAAELGRHILAASAQLPALDGLPRRPTHGDLKISNVRFAPAGHPPGAVCLIDLDTLGCQSIAYEMGDALRSWCNQRGEDTPDTHFEAGLFAAAARGYARGTAGLLSAAERDSMVAGIETVAVELAARFCVDVFDDRYFGWDPARFSSRREHNLVRARGQLHLARLVTAARTDVVGALGAAFADS